MLSFAVAYESHHEVEEGEVVLVAEAQEVPAREERVRPYEMGRGLFSAIVDRNQTVTSGGTSRVITGASKSFCRARVLCVCFAIVKGEVILVVEAQEVPARQERVCPCNQAVSRFSTPGKETILDPGFFRIWG
jgi:hypothetical protein